MKKFNLIFMLLATLSMSAYQGIMEVTYLDVPASEIGRFVELHKTITDMSMGEERTLQDQWVYRHWYGSGHSIVIYDLYASPEDAVKDDPFGVLGKNYQALSDEKKKEMDAVFEEWWGHFENHTDEMRTWNAERNHVGKEDVDWDTPFVFVVGSYNSSGSWTEMGDAFMDWATRPAVENGLQWGGGYTAHYKGTGHDIQVYSGYKNIMEFAESVSNLPNENPEARKKFWSLVDGGHEDQIYVHVGHTVDGKFDLAGKD